MKNLLLSLIVIVGFLSINIKTFAQNYPSNQVVLEILIEVTQTDSFIEFKLESDELGHEYATGHLTVQGPTMFTVNVGSPNQNIWIWWDRLNGTANLEINAVYNGTRTKVFKGTCSFNEHGDEISITNTCRNPEIIQTSGSPRIKKGNYKIDYIQY